MTGSETSDIPRTGLACNKVIEAVVYLCHHRGRHLPHPSDRLQIRPSPTVATEHPMQQRHSLSAEWLHSRSVMFLWSRSVNAATL